MADDLRIALGMLIVVYTGASMISTLVTPRGHSRFQFVGRVTIRTVRLVFVGLARPIKNFEVKDDVLSAIGPVALLAQLVAFLTLFFLGYSLALWPYAHSWVVADREAGSSMFTIGLAHVGGPTSDVLVIMAAATGAIAIALQIGFLPAIYQAFNRREALVTQLEARAGLPAWGPELLARHQLINTLDALPQLYSSWEQWAAELSESHTSYPVLLAFRSPEPWYSWVLALLAVLDGAAMQLSLTPSTAPSEARMCLRMGFTCFRRIASTLRWKYDTDPLPDAPIRLTFEEFEYAVEILAKTGFVMERTAEEAWTHFRGWRVNYEGLAYRLADRLVAPRAPWSGDRRHLAESLEMPRRPPHRTPEGDRKDISDLRRGGLARLSQPGRDLHSGDLHSGDPHAGDPHPGGPHPAGGPEAPLAPAEEPAATFEPQAGRSTGP